MKIGGEEHSLFFRRLTTSTRLTLLDVVTAERGAGLVSKWSRSTACSVDPSRVHVGGGGGVRCVVLPVDSQPGPE